MSSEKMGGVAETPAEKEFFMKGEKMNELHRKQKGLGPEEQSIDAQMAAMRAKTNSEKMKKEKKRGLDLAA